MVQHPQTNELKKEGNIFFDEYIRHSFLAPNIRTSLTGIIDFTAHNIYLIQEGGTVKNILDILFAYGDIAIAELVDVQLNDLGPVIQMYQFIGDINDERATGLQPILN